MKKGAPAFSELKLPENFEVSEQSGMMYALVGTSGRHCSGARKGAVNRILADLPINRSAVHESGHAVAA